MKNRLTRIFALSSVLPSMLLVSHTAFADSAADLAKKLSNPVAALISLPVKFNYDENIGKDEGSRTTITIQPVIPIDLNEEWNIISRTIIPIVAQRNITGLPDKEGLGDVVTTNWFSPKAPSESGWIWGLGPVASLPTATDEVLGSEQWSVGPSALALKQEGKITYGFLAHHLVSVAGDDDRADVSSTFVQPFFAYALQGGRTLSFNTESTYDHEIEEWSIPVNAKISQVAKVGGQMVQFGANLRYWVDGPDSAPEGPGLTLDVTFLFPK